jgi:Bacterial Ig-like domain (group 3)
MMTVKRIMQQCRLLAAVGLIISGLALVATAAPASASTAPGNTIATAGTLTVGSPASGGGNAIDFWKVNLRGGDVVQFVTKTPGLWSYAFALYAPGTTDGSFQNATPFSAQTTGFEDLGLTVTTVFDLQAPYNGTFILAVCESANDNDCGNVDAGLAKNPMDPYTFTTTLNSSGVSAAVAAKETKAATTIAKAPKMGVGHFESGGANAIDFWKMSLRGGDVVQFVTKTPGFWSYAFALYAPGTTDGSFQNARSLSAQTTGFEDLGLTVTSVFDLRAPYNGTFILAVCESANDNDCGNVDVGLAKNPMDPYTFTTTQVGGLESKTSLRLSAGSVRYGHEKSAKFSVAVSALYGGGVTGKVGVWDGKKTVCTIKLVKGKGACTLTSNTELKPGKYSITASYAGNKAASKSGTGVLTVTK